MSSQLAFIKMHGCGNDYVFVDCFTQPAPVDPGWLARHISPRQTGIGSDGLVLMLPPDRVDADARMRMFNSDGSEGFMCGNALRCFAMWLQQTGRSDQQCRIAIRDRIAEATIISSDVQQRCAVVSVNMGPPARLTVAEDMTSGQSQSSPAAAVRYLQLDEVVPAGPPTALVLVSMGNPHAVLFVDAVQEADFSTRGPALERHPVFPDRTNVEFVRILDRHTAEVRVWERGSGETLACGSGACAVAVAGIATQRFAREQPVSIVMRGGTLQVTWATDDCVHLQGPAVEAFRGTLSSARPQAP